MGEVGFLDWNIGIERFGKGRLHPVDADTVADEARRVLAPNDGLPQHPVPEGGDGLQR